jgi:hypothetical protein
MWAAVAEKGRENNMRLMSFKLTVPQMQSRTKFETRRVSEWWYRVLKPGMIIQACEQTQGVAKGMLKRICQIRIVAVSRVVLNKITKRQVVAEGFPDMSPAGFVKMFCSNMKCKPDAVVTRIQFEFV